MFDRIYQHQWITLDRDVREHLTKIFDIPTTGIAEIRDQSVISDGKTNEDLKAITSEKMATYVGSLEEFPRLWELTLSKVKYELHPPIFIPYCGTCDAKSGRHKKGCPKYK